MDIAKAKHTYARPREQTCRPIQRTEKTTEITQEQETKRKINVLFNENSRASERDEDFGHIWI